ncbi:hypothetical protein i14_4254 [Escherichia coli str. 'clone D i14']|uniref:Uncharacterized protein n=1 Tax=Escherichia coli O6:H1 (strain CFT073 / ATCC 700928 / UPEC) TaxID=199310 RepID=A0A0H2VF83_ECOL6|nr:Hypothetical protein c4663 [Escherichia coli CFT073]AER86777.1 hypothetical protein i02_4254 [Escherichia coli str. 'clone D i2']AER91696.1 hypothetical protein i14_4254 [Escherichia coli str. 'clone D i14']
MFTQCGSGNDVYLSGSLTHGTQVNKLLQNIRERLKTTIFSHYPNQVLTVFVQLLTTNCDKRLGERFWRKRAREKLCHLFVFGYLGGKRQHVLPAFYTLVFDGKVKSCFGVGASYRNKFRHQPLPPYSSATSLSTMSLLAASSTERSMIFSAPATARIATCLRSSSRARLRSASISACAWATILVRSCSASAFASSRICERRLLACSMITWASAFAFFSWSVALAFARSRSLCARSAEARPSAISF